MIHPHGEKIFSEHSELYIPTKISIEADICGRCPNDDCKARTVCKFFRTEYKTITGKPYKRSKK